MRVFRPTYKGPDGKTRTCSRYRCEFTDNADYRRRLTLFSTKRESEEAAQKIDEIMARGGKLDRELLAWLERKPKRLREAMAAFGILSESQGAAGRGLKDHVDDWHESLLAKGTKASQADLVHARAMRTFEACGFIRWADIEATAVERFLKRERDRAGGISQQTSNHYVRACKQFCRWMLDNRRATDSPLSHLKGLTVTDKKERRAMTLAERTALLQTTAAAVERFGMGGYERSVLYRIALETGLRGDELRSLTVGDFDLKGLTVTVRAGYAKGKRQDTLPLRTDTAEVLRGLFSNREPGDRAFSMPDADKTTRVFHADCADAGIPYEVDGRKVDFHALRHTFVTEIVRGGATVKEAQTLARHQRAELTIAVYSHVHLNDTRKVVDRLQTLLPTQAKTGTHDA